MQTDLTIVIPCFNEALRLPRTLTETRLYFEQSDKRVEVLVVSDGSTDNTRQIAEELFATLPSHMIGKVIEYFPNRGKGFAIARGMEAAQGERILFMDADYAVPLSDLSKAESALDEGYEIAIGSRALDDTVLIERQSFLRERLSKLFGFIQRNWLGLKVMDTQCGFKLFTARSAKAIFSQVKLTSVTFDGEVLWLAKRLGFRVKEFPVQWTHDQDSRITYTPLKAVYVFLDLLRIPWLHMQLTRKQS